jgi:hypothetical protein
MREARSHSRAEIAIVAIIPAYLDDINGAVQAAEKTFANQPRNRARDSVAARKISVRVSNETLTGDRRSAIR